MISYQDAVESILQAAKSRTLLTESVGLEKAMGRMLDEDIFSGEDLPSFNNSAMDGFCVLAEETANAKSDAPLWFRSLGIIAAGDPEVKASRTGNEPVCIEIMTGAALPESGYDAVVRIEDVRMERNAEGHVVGIGISKPVTRGENVRLSGTDIRKGEKVLSSGLRIEPHHVLSCAALGITELRVKKRPRVAVISTGSELVPMETQSLPRGMIRNSTGVYVCALLSEYGADCRSFGILRDEPSEYRRLLERLQEESYDVVISTGAVSMGKFDFVRDVLEAMGAEIRFHKAAIRPGKPILFAELKTGEEKMAFFGMPGNPVSTAVGCRFFLMPYLQGISGLGIEEPVRGKLISPVKKPKGLRCFYKAEGRFENGELLIELQKSQASYVVGSLSLSNCWAVLPDDLPEMAAGDSVDVYPLSLY